MSFPTYRRYKDSGVGWLGEVPEHWSIEPIRNLARQGQNTFIDGDWIEAPYITDDGVRLIQTGNVGVGTYKEQGYRYVSDQTFTSLRCTEVEPGNILICRLAEPVGRACVAPDLGKRMITSVDVCILKQRSDLDARYLVYMLSSGQYLGFMESLCRGSTRDRVSRSFLGSVRVALPDFSEQQIIAAFLDHETAKIDALVEEQRRLIELLKEKRQAVISHAVTKGLNPNAPMKDSCVEWLGEIPEHWKVTPLMHLTPADRSIMYGIVLPGPNVASGIPIVKGGDVKPDRLRLSLLNRTTAEIEAPFARARLRPNDIVYSIRGTIGEAELVPNELFDANITQDVARVSPKPGVSHRWLLYSLKSDRLFVQLAQNSLGAAVRGINIFDLKRARLPVPPRPEQDAIADYLEDKAKKLNALLSEAEAAVALLQERRTALISAAVTGKIDVRGLVQQPAELELA